MRLQKHDLKWLLPGAALVGTAFALDRTALQNVSTDSARVNDFRRASNLTGIYIPVAAAGTAVFLGNFSGLSVSPVVIAISFSIAVGVGIGAGFVPAFGAYRARITDMLRPA